MNELTYYDIQKTKKHQEAKEKIERIMLTLEKLAVIFCYFVLGYFIGRAVEAIVVGHLNFYF